MSELFTHRRILPPEPTPIPTGFARLTQELSTRGLWNIYIADLERFFGPGSLVDYTLEQRTWAAVLVIGRDILL